MCLAIPGKIVSIQNNDDPLLRAGKVSFGGIIKNINLSYVPESIPGDYVIVHAGFALSRLNEQEALKVFKLIEKAVEEKQIE